MVRLEEVEDEAFVEKPESSKDDILLADDDADYTDTGKPAPKVLTGCARSIDTSFISSPTHDSVPCSQSAYSYHPHHPSPSLTIHLLTHPLHRQFHLRRRAHNPHGTRRVPNRPHPGPKRHNPTPDARETILRSVNDPQRHFQSRQFRREIPLGGLHERAAIGTAVCAGVPG